MILVQALKLRRRQTKKPAATSAADDCGTSTKRRSSRKPCRNEPRKKEKGLPIERRNLMLLRRHQNTFLAIALFTKSKKK
jgi:hypothetical protein